MGKVLSPQTIPSTRLRAEAMSWPLALPVAPFFLSSPHFTRRSSSPKFPRYRTTFYTASQVVPSPKTLARPYWLLILPVAEIPLSITALALLSFFTIWQITPTVADASGRLAIARAVQLLKQSVAPSAVKLVVSVTVAPKHSLA